MLTRSLPISSSSCPSPHGAWRELPEHGMEATRSVPAFELERRPHLLEDEGGCKRNKNKKTTKKDQSYSYADT